MAAAAPAGARGPGPARRPEPLVSPKVEMALGLKKGGAQTGAATPLPVIATPKTPPLLTPPLPVGRRPRW